MRQTREVAPPRGITRLLYQLPKALYRLGLGAVFGSRLLLLEHRGRKTGRRRRTVIEVLRHDPASGVWIVSAGWAGRTQWYRNLRHDPHASIQAGRRRLAVVARFLDAPEAEQELLRYGHAHPRAARAVARMLGYEIDGSDSDLRAFAEVVRVVELREPR